MLSLFNTLTDRKEEFAPLHDKTVGMYHCGPTVYNYPHVGNLRAYVFADILKRALLYEGLSVTQVINITDVGHLVGDHDEGEDKVEAGARKEGKTAQEITEFYTQAFFDDIHALNIETTGTLFPRATENIEEQIALIKHLGEKGYTYVTSDGVYFDTSKFPDYGKLGNINLAGLSEGARVAANTEKKNPTDFALWKFSQSAEKRQQEWESPWGTGFPGWHAECSAMSMKFLGETFDIHTGGIDHIPVHHNNEIAQSEAATGKKFVRFWMHNAFINASGDVKMAKSEENFVRLAGIAEHGIHPIACRYWLLSAHYRSPMIFSWDALEAADVALRKLNAHVLQLPESEGKLASPYHAEFKKLIEDDLDTPKVLALLWKLVKDTQIKEEDKKATILDFDRVLGLNLSASLFEEGIIPQNVRELAEKREKSRVEKNWKEADALREQILSLGYEIRDTEHGFFIGKKR
ncbi:MAG: cysteine--tRNA ligase [Patescibacteria group bacterium]|nr:cysteine--tRNA ligase [bacterium]MDZ4241150.1 cysteine--tRNA ligase [Patescibacteria group bacterium]